MLDIIVPVYNVENYLKKCLESLINQKTSYQYGIILVDDGSTDLSGSICDKYKNRYPSLVNVIHKENGGLSDARNEGVRHSTAKYIVFVDSDDYVGSEFVQNLMENLLVDDVDMVVTPLIKVYENGELVNPLNFNHNSFKIYSKEEALENLLYEKKYGSYAVSKVIPRETLIQFPYPTGKFFEDSFTTYRHILASNRILYLPKSEYYYLQRTGSIQRTEFNMKHMDLIEASMKIYDYVVAEKMSREIIDAAIYKMFKSAHITLYHAVDSKFYDIIYGKIISSLKGKLLNVFLNPHCSFREKILYSIMYLNKRVYKKILKLRIRGVKK